ncbi:hypothetical protein RFI_01984 [Reticulomyxa filosa]|uniref:Uncharacterized protein n=1 Tax=Reticulomyxa filosa TaxID=46433 RepID=X6PA93_RETFI|nr:hypothetical protein RFI_01984 [Reticulomyxa filosa]|eukprot:ETO35091.1 hypothetical protein RFI_01984 [Reticulomyxa filosa]
MPWNIFVTIESRDYELTLITLALDSLKAKILEASKVNEKEKIVIKITDNMNKDIETDEYLKQSIEEDRFHFIAYFQSKKLNYQVFIACDKKKFSPSLTLDNLNDFLFEHEDNLTQNYDVIPYDGLIFIWCGYNKGNDNDDINLLYTSDNKIKYFRDIQQNYHEEKQDPIPMQAQIDAQCINDKDVSTIFVKSIIDTPKKKLQEIYEQMCEQESYEESYEQGSDEQKSYEQEDYGEEDCGQEKNHAKEDDVKENSNNNKGSYFTKLLCQSIENNMDKSIQIILEQVAENISNQNIKKGFMQVNSISTHPSIYLTPKLHNDNNDNDLSSVNKNIPESLNFHRHHSCERIKANIEAAKMVQKMIDDNEQGLIVVTNDISHWKNTVDSNEFSFHRLINNGIQKLEIQDYWVYIIKSRLIILEEITIDGNVCAIQCEIQCKGNVNITTQLFITNQSIIDPSLTSSISPIQWNTKIHHGISIRFQGLENRADHCTRIVRADNGIVYLQNCLHLSIQTFGNHHSYVANAYNNLGLAYCIKGYHDKAIECNEAALKISLDVFGVNHVWTANIYNNSGVSYHNKSEYEKATDCHRKALNIRLEIFKNNYNWIIYSYKFLEYIYCLRDQYKLIEIKEELLKITKKLLGNWNNDVGELLSTLGYALNMKNENERECKYYEEAWKIYNVICGEWNAKTIEAKLKSEL